MKRVYEDFFRELFIHTDNIYKYVNSLYESGTYERNDLNELFGVLKEEGLISCLFAEGRVREILLTFKGKHFFDVENHEMDIQEKTPLIFISHSAKNREKVELFVDLLCRLNLVPQKDILCSSLPGYGIPIGQNIFEFLRTRFEQYDIHAIFIHSPEYYESVISLNEMGAAWVLRTATTSILLPGFGYKDMKGVVNDSEIAIKLDSDPYDVIDKLNQLRSKLEAEFSLTPIPDITWQMAVDRFIEKVNEDTEKAATLRPKVKTLVIKAAADNGTITTMADLAYGKRIEIGKERLASEVESRREYAKWSAALNEAIGLGLISRENKNWCELTDKGYKTAEEISN